MARDKEERLNKMVTATRSVAENMETIERLVEETKLKIADSPLVGAVEITGKIRMEETEDGEIVIRIFRNPINNVTPFPSQEPSMAPSARRRTARRAAPSTDPNILNTTRMQGFRSFILKNGSKTKRASGVLKAYNVDPTNVPGRQIIDWAREDFKHAKEVKVDFNGVRIPLTDFVNEHYPLSN